MSSHLCDVLADDDVIWRMVSCTQKNRPDLNDQRSTPCKKSESKSRLEYVVEVGDRNNETLL